MSLGIGIFAKNEESFISKCIESALKANPAQIFLFDSGSTDNTVELASKYGRIKVITLPTNIYPEIGFGEVYNHGADHLTTKWILNLPGDSFIANPERIEELIEEKQSHIYYWVDFYRPNGDPDYKKYFAFHHGRLYRKDTVKYSFDLIHENLVRKKDGHFLMPNKSGLNIVHQDGGPKRDLHNILEHYLLLKSLSDPKKHIQHLNHYWTTTYYEKNKSIVHEDAKKIRTVFPGLPVADFEKNI